MSATLQQIYALNPTTVVGDNDLFYLVQSPYTPGTDAGIKGSDLKDALGRGTVTSLTAGTGITLTPSPITTTGSIALTVPVVVSSGGTGNTTFTAFSVICAGTTATGAFQNVVGLGTAGEQLTSNGPGLLPTWQAGSTSPLTTKGDIFTFTTVNARLPVGTINGQYLQVNSSATTGLAWSTSTLPSTALNAARILRSDGTNYVDTTSTFADIYAASSLLYANGANNVAGLTTANNGLLVTSNTGVPSILAGPGATGRLLTSNAAAAPSWSTSTFPSVGGAAGNILISDGTNYIASTSLWPNTVAPAGKIIRSDGTVNTYTTTVYPDLVTQNSLLYGSASNTIGLIATVTRSVLTVPSTGLPTYVALTDGQIVIGSTAGSPAAASLSAGTGITITPGSNSISIASTQVGSTITIVDDTTTNATMFPTWVTANTGNLPLKVTSTKLSFNPSLATLTLTGSFSSSTGITSSTGLNLITYSYTPSAVNYLDITNGVTGTGPQIYATGSDSSVGFRLASKGGSFALLDGIAGTAAKLSFYNSAVTFSTSLKAGANSSDLTFILPIADGVANTVLKTSGAGVLSFSSTPISTSPVRTVLTSGSGNYTTSSNVLWLEVELVGGGAGGGSSGTAAQAAGTAGNNTTFGTLTANGGAAGTQYYAGGVGGGASGGDINISGGAGNPGGQIGVAVNGQFGGGNGGNTIFSGAGLGGGIGKVAGGNGAANSGAGGGGGSTDTTSGSVSAGGGGGGGYSRKIISPTAGQVFAYAVGAAANGATAGTNGAAGGNGAAGIIIVTAHYQ